MIGKIQGQVKTRGIVVVLMGLSTETSLNADSEEGHVRRAVMSPTARVYDSE